VRLPGHLTHEFRAAVAIREKLIGEFPDQAEYGRRASIEFSILGKLLWCLGRLREAETALRRSIEISSKFVRQMPGEPHYRICLAAGTYHLGKLLHENKRLDEAVQAFDEALAIYEELASESPSSAQYKRRLGLILATCPALQFRDPPRAVQLAQQAVGLAPASSANWSFLGVAKFRVGDPAAAIDALQKAAILGRNSNAEDCLILAMAHWQAGDRDQAGRWYEQAMEWSTKHQPASEELSLLRAEAKMLFGKARENQ
jgi:tetratricopeptide (TPR) repeat protein